MGARVRRSPVRAPQGQAFCECLIGPLRRERPDSVSPLTEAHLRRILRERASHYNRGRPHASLGPGLPEPSADLPVRSISGHHLPSLHRVVARPILGGLPHDYRPEKVAAYEQGVLVDHTL
jgi:putative transposase